VAANQFGSFLVARRTVFVAIYDVHDKLGYAPFWYAKPKKSSRPPNTKNKDRSQPHTAMRADAAPTGRYGKDWSTHGMALSDATEIA
jgi:hypothetical protein